jgi:hypothetical protein
MEVSSWDNHRTQWWIFQLAIFSKTRSLKSPGLLLTGLLLKVAILAKKKILKHLKNSQKKILKKTQKKQLKKESTHSKRNSPRPQ